MEDRVHPLKQARLRHGWSQEQAIVRIEAVARSMNIDLPVRSSLRTLLSLFENERRSVPNQDRPLLRELYRSTDEELGLTNNASNTSSLAVPHIPPQSALRRPTPEVLTYLSNIRKEHVAADSLTGPRYVRSFIYPQLLAICEMCQVAHGPDRARILFIGAKFAEFYGWVSQDSGDTEAAVYWTNIALDYAQEIGDCQLIAYILMRKSNIVTEAGMPGHGLGLANAALVASSDLAPKIRAVSLRTRARAYSLLAEKANFERDISEAIEYSAELDSRPADQHARYCTPSYVTMEAGMSWVEFAKPAVAIEIFRDSLSTWPSDLQTRDRGLCLARLATAAAAYRDAEAACQAATEALAIARTTGSARIHAQLMSAYNLLGPASEQADVKELRYQLSEISTRK
jgi:transcriptional regulator with XRE-family HTH domain